MDMEEFMGPNDRQEMIMRGKRTKRLRQSSPVNVAVTSSCSSGDGGRGSGEEREIIHSLIKSESVCSEISTSTEEDEDMANCLILLAQSGCQRQVEEEIKMGKLTSSQESNVLKCSTQNFKAIDEIVTKQERAVMAAAKSGGKDGIYVYECKTCNRSFPSFQALGGHRASHKKPKPNLEEKRSPNSRVNCILPRPTACNEQISVSCSEKEQITSSTIGRLGEKQHQEEGKFTKQKMHECSICGSEFSSGQALGGHMRRHRNPTTTKVSMSIDDSATTEPSHGGERPRNILELDLNLPAPPEDGGVNDTSFQFSANQHHLFSSPALVDCHY